MELGYHTCQNEFQHSFLCFFCIILVASVVVCACFVCYSVDRIV